MGNNKKILSSLIVAGSMAIATAQSNVDMSGTVNDVKTGKAIVGAKVFLAKNPNLTATSGADGSFHIVGMATVGIQGKGRLEMSGMSMMGTELSFSVTEKQTPVSITMYNFKSERVNTVLSQTVSAGKYQVNVASSELPAGFYIVNARVGHQSASFKITNLGVRSALGALFQTSNRSGAALVKSSAEPIDDTIKVVATGYRLSKTPITMYNTIYPIDLLASLPAGDLKIVSERPFPQVEWGSNVDVQVWDGGTQLKGDYMPAPFEGNQSWKISFTAGQPHNAWGFVSRAGTPEDMSAWKGGTMHLALKGTASSIGVTMASADQGSGMSVKVNLADYGYLPDGKWHETVVPMDKFEGVDFSQIAVYCGLVYPVDTDTALFNPSLFYQVDDIYWSIKK